eukprot:g1510.t1
MGPDLIAEAEFEGERYFRREHLTYQLYMSTCPARELVFAPTGAVMVGWERHMGLVYEGKATSYLCAGLVNALALEKDRASTSRRVFALQYRNDRWARSRAGDWKDYQSKWGVPSVCSTGYRQNVG